MDCMKWCGSFRITPEPGQEPNRIALHCSVPGPCSCIGPSSAQCEYTINVNSSLNFLKTRANARVAIRNSV